MTCWFYSPLGHSARVHQLSKLFASTYIHVYSSRNREKLIGFKLVSLLLELTVRSSCRYYIISDILGFVLDLRNFWFFCGPSGSYQIEVLTLGQRIISF